jgi:hypothetical protein
MGHDRRPDSWIPLSLGVRHKIGLAQLTTPSKPEDQVPELRDHVDSFGDAEHVCSVRAISPPIFPKTALSLFDASDDIARLMCCPPTKTGRPKAPIPTRTAVVTSGERSVQLMQSKAGAAAKCLMKRSAPFRRAEDAFLKVIDSVGFGVPAFQQRIAVHRHPY